MKAFTKKILHGFPVLFVVVPIIIAILLMTYSAGGNVYVNGKAVGSSIKGAYETTYVPLRVITEGMGGKYVWNVAQRSATITTKAGKQIKVTNGKSVAYVSGKYVPLSTKVVKGLTVPVDTRAIMQNDVIYVPLSFIKSQLGYPVTIKGTVIYVGTVPVVKTPTKPVVTPTKPVVTPTKPAVTPTKPSSGVAGSDQQANLDWLAKNVGMTRVGNGVFYNPNSQSIWGAYLRVSNSGEWADVQLTLGAWIAETPAKTKSTLKFYFPTKYETIYSMINQSSAGTGDKYLGKTYVYDNRKFIMNYTESTHTFSAVIGVPGSR